MKKSVTVLVLLSVGFYLSCGTTKQMTRQAKPQPVQRSTYYLQRKSLFEKLPDTGHEIVFLGNSITDGCNWSELFNDLRVKNRGISGDVTDGVLERLAEVTRLQPDKIFIMIGINDLARGKTEEYVLSNYRKILERIKTESEGSKIYIQSILPVNSMFGKFKNHTNKTKSVLLINRRLRQMAMKFDAVYIDLFSLFATKENKMNPKYSNDGLHLTGDGYLLWKSAVEKYVKGESSN